jgi:4-amino-4-deoxy-L-arabinose transferase-like glycosyltransferase
VPERLRAQIERSEVRWALAILALALMLRLITVAYVHPSPRDGRFDDSVWYDTSARHLAAGDGYVFDPTVWVTADGSRIYPDEEELTPTALWPPGYPVTLAALYLFTDDSLWAARILNIVCGALTAVLVYVIGRRLFGETPGRIAGLLMAIFPGHVLFTPLLLSETYFLFLMTATMAAFIFLILDRREPSPWALGAIGALAGATAMVRGEFVAFAVVLLALLALHVGWRRALVPGAALALGMAAIFVPWTIRNAAQLGEPIAGTTGAGRVALQGHHPDSEGIPSLDIFGMIDAEFADLPRLERELKVNSEGSRRAREYALEHPLDELRLIPRRMLGLMRSDEAAVTWAQSNKPWYGDEGAKRLIRLCNVFFFGTIALALAGAPLWWRTRDLARWLVLAPIPYYLLMFGVVFIGDPRYHFAMYASLVLLASPGLAAILALTREHWRDVFGGRSLGDVLRTYGTPRP